MKKKLLQGAIAIGVVLLSSLSVQAQKFGDNLGNHTATKNINAGTHQIFNTTGIAIGTAIVSNESIALEIQGDSKSILITRTDDLAKILNPQDGMIVYLNTGVQETSGFRVHQNGAWSTFASGLTQATGLGDANAAGYTITVDPVTQQTLISLSPATETSPGVVTIAAQSFAGLKTFIDDVVVNGNLTIGSATVPSATTINGTLATTGNTTLNGTYDILNPANGGVVIQNISEASNTTAVDERPLVIDVATGAVKRSTQAVSALDKKLIIIGAADVTLPFDPEGNSGAELILTIDPAQGFLIKEDDGIVVNFSSASYPELRGLSILSAVASADNQVRVYIADMRNPADTNFFPAGYVAPDLTGKGLVVTKYNKVVTP